ncbi:MAG: hypothetical protein D6744_09940 [Planctomycetota bacterium]|nr:MAG: hypothetical protein D6744_09940 [Planctomycetota bacterium]
MVRCPACQRRVAIPRRLPAHCDRCGHEQRIRNLFPYLEQPCANCGHTLSVHEVQLRTLRRRRASHRTVDTSFRRRLSAATMLLIYAVFLVSALAWVARRL